MGSARGRPGDGRVVQRPTEGGGVKGRRRKERKRFHHPGVWVDVDGCHVAYRRRVTFSCCGESEEVH